MVNEDHIKQTTRRITPAGRFVNMLFRISQVFFQTRYGIDNRITLMIRYGTVSFSCFFRIITSAMYTPAVIKSAHTAAIQSGTGAFPVLSVRLLFCLAKLMQKSRTESTSMQTVLIR